MFITVATEDLEYIEFQLLTILNMYSTSNIGAKVYAQVALEKLQAVKGNKDED
jgi:hypothetical protein